MRGSATHQELVHLLYRRAFKIISLAQKKPHTQRVVQSRWAEFLPRGVQIGVNEDLRRVARRSFEVGYSPTVVSNAFAFLKEAEDSFYTVWVLAEWEHMVGGNSWDLCDGVALVSAALYGAPGTCKHQHAFEALFKDYQVCFRAYVKNVTNTVKERVNAQVLGEGHAEDLHKFLEILREVTALARRDATPEDFSLISLLQHKCAAEYLLNIVIVLVLRALHVNCTLVGAELSFRWVRVMGRSDKASPVFVSWTYGAMRRREADRIIHTADRQWYRSVPWDAQQRKYILCALLRRQLGCLSRQSTEQTKKLTSTCKEQLLFLLSL